MVDIDKSLIDKLNNINWFYNCNNQFNNSICWNYEQLRNINQVKKYISKIKWFNLTLNTTNTLTDYLFHNYKDEYNNYWNKIVIEFKKSFLPTIKENITCYSQIFLGNVYCDILENIEWILINMITAYSYKCYFMDSYKFYAELLKIYETGFLPCGWVGKYPQGRILIY